MKRETPPVRRSHAGALALLGLMTILVLLPLQILSGALTPRESMPDVVRWLMSLAPTTHFVSLGQGVLFRGAGIDVVWPEFLMVSLIGAAVKFHLPQTGVQRFRHAGALLQLLPGGGEENRHQYAAGAAHHHRQAFAN